MKFTPEAVGYWYLRLNGFLTITNFVVHPDEPGNQKTDADVIGVRFPHRAELLNNPMIDDDVFMQIREPFIALTEIKSGRCEINPTFRRREQRNVERILMGVGAFSADLRDEIAESMYATGEFSSEVYKIAFCCIGDQYNHDIGLPNVLQITWDQVLSFIFRRFSNYRNRKYDHPQWDENGKLLWNVSSHFNNERTFAAFVKDLWKVNQTV